MTGPGARLDAENDNLQAYCNNLEAEIGTLRERIRTQLEVISALKEHRAEDAQRIVALEQRLWEALKLLRDGDDNFTMDHHPGCNDRPCNCGLGKHLVAVRRLVDTSDNAALLAKQPRRCTCGDDFVAVTGAHDARCPLAKQP